MELTKELFRKLILLTIGLTILEVGMGYLPIFSNYELLEEQLHQGYLRQFVILEVHLAIYLLIIVTNFAGLFLLYKSKPVGRLIYLISFIAMTLVLTLDADLIERSLLYPLTSFNTFLEFFILYLAYFTPLKKEFSTR